MITRSQAMRTITRAIGLMLLLGMAPIAGAQSFEDGKAAYDRGDFTAAMKIWRSLALQGDPDAQVSLGAMYHMGKGAPKDNVHAYMWFDVAATEIALFGNEDPVARCKILAEEMTVAEIDQAKKMSEQCFDSGYKQCD
jgi:hypothetical protein